MIKKTRGWRLFECVYPPVGKACQSMVQTLCFLAGAYPIFYDDRLFAIDNPEADSDPALIKRPGLQLL
ncbi:hypothetical protein [Nitrosomonas cryotolerans]|uniref:hypothetical protein n=1 Tax=Nitrosomonas cryotolerans TaxID=44575 RepID=UPI00048E869C|nr:hypothetical protein [Nitrosomonas cryotolerans]